MVVHVMFKEHGVILQNLWFKFHQALRIARAYGPYQADRSMKRTELTLEKTRQFFDEESVRLQKQIGCENEESAM
jgi:hypothetical protein